MNHKNYITHTKIECLLLFFFLYFSFLLIKCEKCDQCFYNKETTRYNNNNNQGSCINCRHYHNTENLTYKCEGNNEEYKFYTIYMNESCQYKEKCDNKVINETKECVGHCPSDTYELGDYCYYIIDYDRMINITEKPFGTLKCKYKFNITKDSGDRIIYNCFINETNCTTPYYDGDTLECIETCNKNYIKQEDGRCSSKCNNSEYIDIDNKYCLDNCPNYYYESLDGPGKCVNECNFEDIYDVDNNNKKCVKDCGNRQIKFDNLNNQGDKKVKQCFTITNGDEKNYFYYNHIYFTNCSDTQLLFDKTTYLYNESTQNCTEDCSYTNYTFLDGIKCVESCENSKYFYDNKCLDQCEYNNYTLNLSIINNNIDITTDIITGDNFDALNNNIKIIQININELPKANKCLDNCPIGTYIDQDFKQCYISSCPNGKFINSSLKCIDSCSNSNEGYIFNEKVILKIIEEKKVQQTENGESGQENEIHKFYNISRNFCLPSCPKTSPYYEYNKNECYNTPCSERKLYSSYNNPYICYNSCQLIGNEYNYESNYICYNKSIICDKPYYYKDKNGFEKCADYNECKELGFKYIKDKECLKECGDDYSCPDSDNLGKCFKDSDDCIKEGYPFFNSIDKICRKNCDLYKTSENNPIKNKEGETCFSSYASCPENYSYIDENNKLCLKKCPTYFYGNKCVDECQGFYFKDEFECLDTCKKDGKYYYKKKGEEENICYYSCPSTHPYVESASDNQKEPYTCIDKCPDTAIYYYEDKKICRKACDILYNSTNENDKICVTHCLPGQKVYNKFCYDSCPDTVPFIVKEKLSDTYNEIVEKCYQNCPSSYQLISNSTNYCLNECPISESYKYNGKCYEKCPNGTFPDDIKKECSTQGCPSNLKYYEIIDGNIQCKMSCPSNKYALINGGECLDKCPKEYNFIGGNVCLNNCSINYGEYYKFVEEVDKGNNEKYNIYECKQSCEGKLITYNNKECLDECPENYYKSMNNICYEKCNLDLDYPFSTKNDKNELVCEKQCHKDEPNFGSDKICKVSCSDFKESNITDYDGACVSECTNQFYNYLEDWKCVDKCSNKKYITKDLKCVDTCAFPNNYIEENECKDKCESYHFYKQIEENGVKQFQCVLRCDSDEYYYETEKKCLKNCGNGKIIQNTQICINTCPNIYKTYYYDGTNTSTYMNNTCVLECPKDKPLVTSRDVCTNECSGNTLYHIEDDVKCINHCPSTHTIIDNFICRSSCPDKFFDPKQNKCVEECNGNDKYYIPGENVCLSQCNSTLYRIDGNKCVTSCNETFYLIDDNKCSNQCPDNKNYIVKYYHDDNNNIPYTCLDDCPQDYPYYSEEIIGEKTINVCKSECDYKNEISNNGKNATLCLEKCESSNYYDAEEGKCKSSCGEKKYYVKKYINESSSYNQCYSKCPKDFPYSSGAGDLNECVKNCSFIDYEKKTCKNNCNEEQTQFEENGITYCLNNCSVLGLFTNHNTCVRECNTNDNLIGNMETKACECEYLFIINNNIKQCLPSNIKNCHEIEGDLSTYNIRKYNEKECVKKCDKFLSLDGHYCYENETYCPINTENKDNKCQCKNKYYNDSTSGIICLGEKENCPSTYPLLMGEKECVKSCIGDSIIEYDGKCLNESNFEGFDNIDSDPNKKICNKYWYLENSIYHCDDRPCNNIENYNYLIDNTKHCVQECNDNIYFIYDTLSEEKKCVSSCNNTYSKLVEENNNKYSCRCKNKWYKEENGNIKCSLDPNEKCSILDENKPFYIKETNQCINKCTDSDDYKYYFNDECFSSCDKARDVYGYNVKNSSSDSNECICENLWIKEEDNKKTCISDLVCNQNDKKLVNNTTKECVQNCGNNYKFKNICYERCPDYLNQNEDIKECECKYLWYEYKDETYNEIFKNCLSENEECPSEYQYTNNSSNQCVSSCEGLYKFNYKCYDNCPDNTNAENSECICSQDKPWYQYVENGKKYLKCNINKCPENKKKLNKETNECLTLCNDEQYYYNDECYNNCPDNTRLVDKISKTCIDIEAFDEAKTLSNLEEIIKNDIKEIYPTTSKGGLVYNINNSTLQIYGVNKMKTENQELIMRSNLTYIDLSNCINKIYEKNGLSDDTDIVIVKYDIGDVTDSLNINPVEYKIVNSKTGNVIPLDACEDNSIIISYPINTLLNNFDLDSNKLRNLEEDNIIINLNIREKFLKGKELYLENEEIDSFNIDNKLYTDMCYPLKINGKDLTLEDRFNYLYPIYSFCESNCVYNKTDFIYQRVYCNCSPKEEVNFERNFELLKVDVDAKTVKDNQKGSILKCLSKVKNISKNFGFFYGLIIFLVEIGMGLLTLFYSYKIFIMSVQKKFDIKGNDNNDEINNNIDTENIENIENASLTNNKKHNKRKMEEIIKTSERDLDNPPKKNNNKLNINNNKYNKNNKKEEPKKSVTSHKDELEVQETINIKKLKIKNNKKNEQDQDKDKEKEKDEEKISSSISQNIYYEKSSSAATMKNMEDEGIFDLVKMEAKLLRVNYDYALRKNTAEIIIMILTEILDKIYLIKSIWLLQKYEIFSLYFSLYLLWHFMMLSFLSLFYNNSTIQKIWLRDNYPDLNYYLSFGFVACILAFIIYKGLSFLINNDKKIKEIDLIARDNNNKAEVEQKFNKMMFWAKIKLIIFYVVQFILLFLFYLYLIAFFGIYTGTSSNLVESYGIALIEVVIIKVLYGLVLGVLRKISLTYEIKILYSIVLFLDLYIS